jgi:hypothetical protein
MPSIIVSYRRTDTDVISGRIRDRLASHYGPTSVFMDIDSIPFGIDFREHIKSALQKNDILIAIIGPNWIGKSDASTRLLDEADPVRLEVEAALQRGIPVVPVLVSGAPMPKSSELPDSLKDLPFRNAAIVDGGRDFHQHMDRLIRSMDGLLTATSKQPEEASAAKRSENEKRGAQKKLSGYRLTVAVLSIALIVTVAALAYSILQNQFVPPISPPLKLDPPQPITQTSVQPSVSPTASQPLPATRPPCNTVAHSASAYISSLREPELGWVPPIGLDEPRVGKITSHSDGGVTFLVPEKFSYVVFYSPVIFSNLNACVQIRNPPEELKDPEKSVVSAGISFWVQDVGNNYLASIFLQPPSVQLFRRINGNLIGAGINPAPDLKTEPSAVNELQIVTVGDIGAQYVNGKKVGEFKGQPPWKAPAGLVAQSGPNQKHKWTFFDFSISEYQPP